MYNVNANTIAVLESKDLEVLFEIVLKNSVKTYALEERFER